MHLNEILNLDCVKVPLDAQNKQDALYELVDLLAEHHNITDVQQLKDAVWEREITRTTGIGHGIAIPHGKSDCCKTLMLAVGKPATPLEYDAIDQKPVNIIFLLLSPRDQTGPHIQALASISRMLVNEETRQSIIEADSAQAVVDLILKSDA